MSAPSLTQAPIRGEKGNGRQRFSAPGWRQGHTLSATGLVREARLRAARRGAAARFTASGGVLHGDANVFPQRGHGGLDLLGPRIPAQRAWDLKRGRRRGQATALTSPYPLRGAAAAPGPRCSCRARRGLREVGRRSRQQPAGRDGGLAGVGLRAVIALAISVQVRTRVASRPPGAAEPAVRVTAPGTSRIREPWTSRRRPS